MGWLLLKKLLPEDYYECRINPLKPESDGSNSIKFISHGTETL
jgi:hypothetical protein